jgi:D-sedoheptulose 7-phosphate isomerase
MNNFIKNIVDTLSIIDNKKLELLKTKILENNSEIIILGNGGSNAIASHMAEDYTKALGKRATCFSDASRLTCYANDYGYDFAFVQFLKEFSTKDSLVILISSSGNSKNILNCAQYCMDNNLSKNKSFLDFWVNSKDYGIVECSHEIILHSVI